MKKLLISIIAILFSIAAYSHALKISTSKITIEENKALVKINFFADDLHSCLAKKYGDDIDLLKYPPATHQYVLQYIEQTFSLKINGKQQKLVFKEKTLENNVFIIKFITKKKFSYKEGETDIHIFNRFMLDQFKGQTNIMWVDLKGDDNGEVIRFDFKKQEMKLTV